MKGVKFTNNRVNIDITVESGDGVSFEQLSTAKVNQAAYDTIQQAGRRERSALYESEVVASLLPSTADVSIPGGDFYQAIDVTEPVFFLPAYRPVVESNQFFFQDSDGNTAASSGQPVGSIYHKGNRVSFQTISAARPVAAADGIIFSGSHFMQLLDSAKVDKNKAYTIYVDVDRNISSFSSILSWADSSSAVEYLLATSTAERLSWRVGTTGGGSGTNNTFPNGNAILTAINDREFGLGYVNNVEIVSQAIGSQTVGSEVPVLLGARYSLTLGAETFFNGKIRCVLIYDSFHDTETRQQIIDTLLSYRL